MPKMRVQLVLQWVLLVIKFHWLAGRQAVALNAAYASQFL